MSWNNNTISAPNWAGNVAHNKSKYLQVSTIIADQIVTKQLYANEKVLAEYLETASVSSVNGSIAFLSNLVLNTGVIGLGVGPTYLTAANGILYVNGDALGFPSSFSTIADWSQFKAVADLDMSRSSIYNVHSISTNTISTGILLSKDITTNGLSTINISSANITYDTLNGRAGTVGTLSGSNLVYCNATFSNINAVNTFTTRLNTSNIVGSNDLRIPSISTILISSFLVEADTLYGRSTATGYLAANQISTGTLTAYNIYNVKEMILSDIVIVPEWSSTQFYEQGTLLKYNGIYYRSKVDNLNVVPNVNIPEWPGPATWSVGNCVWVNGLGTFRCLVGGYYVNSINGYPDEWVNIGAGNLPNLVWLSNATPIGENTGEIRGNDFSLVQVGRISTMSLNTSSLNTNTINASNINASTINVNKLNINTLNISSFSTLSINVSTLNTNNISSGIINLSNLTSYNITNSNSLSNGGNFSNTGNFSNAGDAQMNTLTTHGQVYTQNILNVQGLMSLQSDVYGEVNNITLEIPPFTTSKQYLKDINDIRTGNFQTINIVGGSTGNTITPDYYEYSELNVGATETSPAIVTLYGVNLNPFDPLTNLTTALTVYGDTSLYGNTSFYPLNGSLTAYSAYGNTYTYGTATVDGLFTAAGAVLVEGILTTLGNANVGGVATVTGIGTFLGGIAITGLFSAQNSEINFNNQVGGSSYTFTNWGITNLKNGLTLNGDGTATNNFNVNGSLGVGGNEVVDGNLTVNGLIFGTVVSGSETVSTLNVSTIRAFNISSITNTTQEFFVSSIAGYSNRIIEFNNDIKVPTISTTTLNFINGTGNQLLLQSYEGQGPTLGFSRTIDGVDFLDGAIATTGETGFIVAGFSTINVSALNDISIRSAENVNLVAENNVNISTNILYVENAAAISSIYTNYIESKLIDLYTQDVETPAAIVFNRDIDGEKVPDGAIATNNEDGFQISAASTMKITTLDDMLIRSVQGNIGIVSDNSNIIISAPETIIPYNLNVSSISTGYVIAGTLIATNGIGTANVTTSNLFSDYTSTGSIYANSATIVNDLSANNLFTTNLLTYYIGNPLPFQSPIGFNDNLNISGNDIYNTFTLSASNISTNLISSSSLLSGSIFTNSYNGSNAGANLNMNGNLIPTSAVPKDLGNSGAFRWNNLWVSTISSIHVQTSTIRATQTITASTIAVDRIRGAASDTNIFTQNLFPLGAGAQLGFGPALGSGGYYNFMFARSTFTTNINPVTDGVTTSNNIKVSGNLSTQNVFVSSINNKLYPYTSTLNIPFSSFSITGNQAGTPILLYSNIDFRTQGFHRISQKAILSKNSGGTSADIHANIFYSLGSFPSTPSITDGYSALPFVNQDNASTFTTLMTEFYVSTPTTRSIFYYDSTANNYTSRLYMGTLFDSVTPDFGNNATRIPNIL